ncbi:glutaredoxin 3 [Trichloromonas acetexigens]|jgi:glutaredoxin 3|uniref:Glutaredoxin n=1 Tax=Trichloromonas acetexigens TaxID=38815 RepID=A0A550JJ02_9BACT|nr:glutaredoxin 3 [Desulfuromonas acetexigens]TRO83180.1 glutaredoxin 3 [Desulfuromonas acetexigens]
MKTVEIYTKNHCPYCWRAKELLRIKGVDFREIDISDNLEKAREMRERSGRQTVPEIFIDGRLIGGCDELFELDERGELARILALNPPSDE